MPKITQYVDFNVSELPIGHDVSRTIQTYGFRQQVLEPREVHPREFRGRIGEIEGHGSYGKLFRQGSLTQGEQAALWNAYLLHKKGAIELSEPQIKYLDSMFDRVGYGNVLETIIDFDNGDRSMKAPPGSRRVLMINRPNDFSVKNGQIAEVNGGERKPKIWSANGYVARTCDGPYDEDGFPILTLPTRQESEQTWLDAGADQEFASMAVSYAWSRNEGQGKAIVRRGFFIPVGGRFNLGAYSNPDVRDDEVGRVPRE